MLLAVPLDGGGVRRDLGLSYASPDYATGTRRASGPSAGLRLPAAPAS